MPLNPYFLGSGHVCVPPAATLLGSNDAVSVVSSVVPMLAA